MHAFAGLASFVLIVAVVLYLAQFPPCLSWIRKLKRKSQGYSKVEQEDHELDSNIHHRGKSSAVASASCDGHVDNERFGALRRRKLRHLRINTRAEYRGLGIAVPGKDESGAHEEKEKRRSYDEEALQEHQKSPMVAKWQALTAPLPSLTGFTDGENTPRGSTSVPAYAMQSDIESGRRLSQYTVSSPDMFDIRSPLHHHLRTGEGNAHLSNIFERVNNGIYSAADRLSRTFHDKVTGPEEGLLLPVHYNEHEKTMTKGVFVD